MKNPFLLFLVVMIAFGNVADVITTQYIIAGESNPLYHATGTLFWVYLLKVAITAYLFYRWWRGTWSSIYEYHICLTILMITVVLLWLAAGWNAYAAMHPAIIANASSTAVSQRVSQYYTLMLILYVIPFFSSVWSFIATERTRHSVYIYSKDELKTVKWWRRL